MEKVPSVALEEGRQQMVVAQPAALDVMLVVDTSGSMNAPVVEGSTVRKWDELKSALLAPETGFLARNSQARFGLTTFPEPQNPSSCDRGGIRVPLGKAEGDNLDPIAAFLEAVEPTGGTPTTPTLALLDDSTFPPAEGRRRLAVVLTDGLPNCNPSDENVARCDQCNADPSSCQATDGCRPTFGDVDRCEYNQMHFDLAMPCLDEQGLVDQVDALRQSGIETVVLGFGAQTQTPMAFGVLNRAALAGGWAREAEQRFYQANDAAELAAALEKALRPVRCTFDLGRALDAAEFVSVALVAPDGSEVALQREADWTFRSPTELRLIGSRCDQIDSYRDHRVEVRWASKI